MISAERIKRVVKLSVSETGLVQSIEKELERIQKIENYQTQMLLSEDQFSLDKHKELILFCIFQEALNNIMKLAYATSITVRLHYSSNRFVMEVSDDGQGFDLAKSTGEIKEGKKGLGIKSIQSRAKLIEAEFCIQSSCGKGTTIQTN